MTSEDDVRPGGLMRCCTETIDERETPGQDGDRIECRYCHSPIVFRKGAWEWGHARRIEQAARELGRGKRG